MASPNHKAGLAVVVPDTNNQSPIRGKVKQHSFSSPRKPAFYLNGLTSSQESSGMPLPPFLRYTNGTTSPRQSNGTAPPRQMNGVPFQRRPSGPGPQQSNGAIPARSRLLGVDDALKYSPFSSIVPFGSGKYCSDCQRSQHLMT